MRQRHHQLLVLSPTLTLTDIGPSLDRASADVVSISLRVNTEIEPLRII